MGSVMLDGVDRYRVTDPVFESARIVLSYLGESYTPDYIQGIAGGAFRIAGICPCAPTCSNAMWVPDLINLLGYDMQYLKAADDLSEVDYRQLEPLANLYETNGNVLPEPGAVEVPDMREVCERVHTIVAAVKNHVRAGTPAILWHAFTTAEYDVVTGFDEEDGTFLGWGAYGAPDGGYAEAPWGRTITTAYVGGQPNAIIIGERVRPFDARSAELAALQEGVRHARSQHNVDKLDGDDWQMLDGLRCYDRWINDWRDPGKKRTMGDAYCLGVYRATHRAGAGFMRELAPKYPAAAGNFERAAAHFIAEADALDACVPLFWWGAPEGPDPARNAKTVPLLQQARDAYARAIDEIEAGLAMVES